MSDDRDLDADGYPTDALLERVKLWPHHESYHDLMALVQANWHCRKRNRFEVE
jgi:hypothetical protein